MPNKDNTNLVENALGRKTKLTGNNVKKNINVMKIIFIIIFA